MQSDVRELPRGSLERSERGGEGRDRLRTRSVALRADALVERDAWRTPPAKVLLHPLASMALRPVPVPLSLFFPAPLILDEAQERVLGRRTFPEKFTKKTKSSRKRAREKKTKRVASGPSPERA